jgi:hypothetical protein
VRDRVTRRRPLLDATLATTAAIAAVGAGSRGFADLDHALLGYLGGTLVAVFATTYRASAFYRRPASAFYARAVLSALRSPRRLRATLAAAGRDLAAQRFVARRSRTRWAAHLLLSLGTLAGVAITVPLVFGWMHFAADGERGYRVVLAGFWAGRFALGGVIAWAVFHALAVAAVAVVLGASYFLLVRLRARRLPETATAFHMAPLLLLLIVALSGLALPTSHGHPALFDLAARVHELSVVVLLVAVPCSKLGHVLVRPLHLGAQLVRSAVPPEACASCGVPLAPAAQRAAVERLLASRGFHFEGHVRECPRCRRRALAAAQATLLDAHFQPSLACGRPAPARPSDEEAA